MAEKIEIEKCADKECEWAFVEHWHETPPEYPNSQSVAWFNSESPITAEIGWDKE